MSKHNEIVDHFKGRIVSGIFTKLDGTKRRFWGILKHEDRDLGKDLVTVYDLKIKQYRRFRLDSGTLRLKSGNIFYKYNHANGITLKTRSA
jgi:hypothetical protein